MLQTTPLRACVLQELALGSSCHDQSQKIAKADVEAVALDGCVAHPAEGAHQCVCERPKASADRSGASMMGVDLLPAVYPTLVLVMEPAAYCLNLAGQKLLEPCPPARILPLLN